MIHVLLEERLYDEPFVREWTNGAFLVRADTQQLLTGQDLAPSGDPQTLPRLGWQERWPGGLSRRCGVWTGRGRARARLAPFPFTLAMGRWSPAGPPSRCSRSWPPSMPRSGRRRITWVPAGDVRRAVRLFATEQPVLLLHLGGTRTAHRRHADQPGGGSASTPSPGSSISAAATCSSPAPPPIPSWGSSCSPGASRPSARLCRAPAGSAGHSRALCAAYDVYRAILTGHPYPVKALVAFGSDPLLGTGIPCGARRPWRRWTSMCTWTCSPIPAPPWPTCSCPPAPAGSARPSCPPSAARPRRGYRHLGPAQAAP